MKEVSINIKGVPYLLQQKFKQKCKEAGTKMTPVQIRLMEMVRDGEVLLEKSANIRFRKDGEGQQEKMLQIVNLELAEVFLAGAQEDALDFSGVKPEDILKHWEERAKKIVKKLCKI